MDKLLSNNCFYVDLSGNGTLVDLERNFPNHIFSRQDKYKIKGTFDDFFTIKLSEYLESVKEGKSQMELFDLGFEYLNKYFAFSSAYTTNLSYLHKIGVKEIFFKDFGTEWFLFLNPSYYKPKIKKGLLPSEMKLGIKFILCSAIRTFYDTKLLQVNLNNREYYEKQYLKVFKKVITEEERNLKLFLTWSIYRQEVINKLDFDKVMTGYSLRQSALVRKIISEEKNIFTKFKESTLEDLLELFDRGGELITDPNQKRLLISLLEYIIENFKAETLKDFNYMY